MKSTLHISLSNTNHCFTFHVATLPKEKPFRCPECNQYEAKTRINLWTHFLGKHNYSKKWTEEILRQRQPEQISAHNNVLPQQSAPHYTPPHQASNHHTPNSQQQKQPTMDLQATMAAAIHASMQAPLQAAAFNKTQLAGQSPVRPAMSAQESHQAHQQPPPPYQQHLQPQMPSSTSRLQSLLEAAKPGSSSVVAPPPPYPGQTPIDVAAQNGQTSTNPQPFSTSEIKIEVKAKEETTVTLPLMPSLPFEDVIKAEMKTEVVKLEPDTKTTPPTNPKTNTTPKSSRNFGPRNPSSGPSVGALSKGNSVEFWCDLCQKLIKFVARWSHYASIHFEAKIRDILPASDPFLCTYCTHVGKDLTKLTKHFLERHDMLEEWIRQELDIMEDDIIAKSNNDLLVIPAEAEADFEEHPDDNVENAPLNGQQNTDLITLISQLYPEVLREEPQTKKRKISRSIRDRGLEAIKDIIEPRSTDLDKYNRIQQSFPTSREPIPVRIMTSTVASKLWPQVPHHWFCNGKLLMLTDPNHPNNLELFQGQWIRGQPVIVANVHKRLNMDIWSPEAFNREFGHLTHDIVNTKTGKVIPAISLKRFWDGFEHLKLRMTDQNGLPILWKLKDWPPGEDLAHALPTRFEDLMRSIPLTEYTSRTGRFNLASFMPDYFVRPDLGPKMYIAYGNALYPNTGTTNLHIDMSDACNL